MPGLLDYIFANMHTLSSDAFSGPATQATLPKPHFKHCLKTGWQGHPHQERAQNEPLAGIAAQAATGFVVAL